MDLLTFREFFRKQSGRFDLVNSDGSDNGADVFINAGQKDLDRLVDIPAGIGRVFKDIVAGDFLVTFQDCRAILEVWCIGTNAEGKTTRLPLTKETQQDLRGVDKKTLVEGYTEMMSNVAQDRPKFYTPAQLRLVTDANGQSGSISGSMDVLSDGFQNLNGVFFMPPADGNYSIEIIGNFYTKTLKEDTDYTFWSDQHPTILYMATMRQLEIMHRNTEGVKDWDRAIANEVGTIDMDGVMEGSSDVNQMEG